MEENTKKLVDDVKSMVESIFAEKEKAEQISKTEKALNESATVIDKLNNTLEETQNAFETFKESSAEELETTKEEASKAIAEKETKISELSEELEAAQKKAEEAESELASVKEELENIKKDRITETRMQELTEAKVVMANAVDTQAAKVREMTDEEFASYKDERVALRKSVEEELAANSNSTDNNASGEENASEEEEEETPAADIPMGQAIHASLNMETQASSSMISKYKDLGKAMADAMSKSDK
jgi:chromosome segregation ATPase